MRTFEYAPAADVAPAVSRPAALDRTPTIQRIRPPTSAPAGERLNRP